MANVATMSFEDRLAEVLRRTLPKVSPEARAQRRWRQLIGRGESVAYEAILEDIRARDARDASRAAAPLRPAPDAALLDTTDLSIDEAFDAARRIVEAARDHPGPEGP